MKVTPKITAIEVVPSEDPDYVACLLVHNEFVDATLKLTSEDVKVLMELLVEYELEKQ